MWRYCDIAVRRGQTLKEAVSTPMWAPREAVTACELANGESVPARDFTLSFSIVFSRTYELSEPLSLSLQTADIFFPHSTELILEPQRFIRNSQTRTQASFTASQRKARRYPADLRLRLPIQSNPLALRRTSTHLRMNSSTQLSTAFDIDIQLDVSYSYVIDVQRNSKQLYSWVDDLPPREIDFRAERDIYYTCRSIGGAHTSLRYPTTADH
jgi:hypothetical protein